MKTCRICKQDKPYSEYVKNKTNKDGYTTECNICRRKDARERYARKRDQYLENSKKKQQKRKEQVDAMKSPCVVCGWFEYPEAIDFHHRDSATKSGNVGTMTASAGMDKIRAEVAKCVCLCANCHRGVHAGKVSLPNE